VSGLPRELLDGMAEFAAGIRRWSEWRHWFAGRAGWLVRVMDRGRFEQLKHDPEGGVTALLQQEGVTIRPFEPRYPGRPDDPIRAEEYEIYTALCRQLDLFQFDLPGTVFEAQTDGDSVLHSIHRWQLEFDTTRREYRLVEPELAERFPPEFRRRVEQYPEMLIQYESRNQSRWPLEKRFEVHNGYRLVPELGEDEQEEARGAFCLSRVGLSADGRLGLVFIRYAVTCAYYVVFERSPTRLERVALCMSWVT
jgi:hypothetical protein